MNCPKCNFSNCPTTGGSHAAQGKLLRQCKHCGVRFATVKDTNGQEHFSHWFVAHSREDRIYKQRFLGQVNKVLHQMNASPKYYEVLEQVRQKTGLWTF